MFLLCLDTTPDQERAFFEQLYLKYHRLMYKTASMYVTDQSDIEDVLQDAIERLLVRTPKLMRIPCCALPTILFIQLEVQQSTLSGTNLLSLNTLCLLSQAKKTLAVKTMRILRSKYWKLKSICRKLGIFGGISRTPIRNCSIGDMFWNRRIQN